MDKKDMATIETLTELAIKLAGKRDRLTQHLSDVQKDLDSVNNTLRLINKLAPESDTQFVEVPIEDLRGKTIDDGLGIIAERNGGTLRVRYAKPLLVKAEVVAEKNAAASIYTVIGRSERWEKIDSGIYKLLPSSAALPKKLQDKLADPAADDDDIEDAKTIKQRPLSLSNQRVARMR